MSFVESRLLDCVAYGFQGGPTFATNRVTLRTGMERRGAMRSRPKYRFTAPYQNLDQTDHAAVIAVFNACLGSAYGFRFKDWADFTATLESLGNTPGANQTAVQLKKTYTVGALSTTRNIVKPVAGTVTVYQNGVAKAGSLDTTTGLFTPTTNWTAGQALTWSGEFDVPVIFASDELIFDYNNFQRLTSNIVLEEDLSA